MAIWPNDVEQFLNCLNDSLTFSKDLKPVDPDNIQEGVLYSKEFISESDRKFIFELMETVIGTRNLKITKNQTGSDPIELNIPAKRLVYVTSEMKKRIKSFKNKKETQQAKTTSNNESVEKPENKNANDTKVKENEILKDVQL